MSSAGIARAQRGQANRRIQVPRRGARLVAALALSLAGCASPRPASDTGPGAPPSTVPAQPAAAAPQLTPASVAPPPADLHEPGNFDALRQAYARRADFSARCEAWGEAEQFAQLFDARQFAPAAALAQARLQRCPVAAKAHLWASAALRETGRGAEAETHMQWFVGLTESALRSGSGRSADDPIQTISVAEEYAVLARLGLQPIRQSLLEGERRIDAIEAETDDGRRITLYFDPYWHFVRMDRKLGAPAGTSPEGR